MRNSFTFHRSFYDAIKSQPLDVQVELYSALTQYALDGIAPSSLSPVAQSLFSLMIPLIEINYRAENGRKGGAPKGNKNACKKAQKSEENKVEISVEKQAKKQAKNKLKQPKNNLKQPNSTPYNNNNILSTSNEVSNNYYLDNVELNKFNIINSVVDVVDVANCFFKKVTEADFIRRASASLCISENEFRAHARSIIAEWTSVCPENFLPENTPEKHLVNQIRIKRDSPTERKAAQDYARRMARQAQPPASTHNNTPQQSASPPQPTGHEAFKIYLRSKGLAETTSLLDIVTTSSGENEAISEARRLLKS